MSKREELMQELLNMTEEEQQNYLDIIRIWLAQKNNSINENTKTE